jgi:hypothetical protein
MSYYEGIISLHGDPGIHQAVTLTDAFQDLATILSEDLFALGTPVAALVSVATGGNAAQVAWSSTGAAPSAAGHEIAAAGSVFLGGTPAVTKGYFRNAAAGSNAAAILTVFY